MKRIRYGAHPSALIQIENSRARGAGSWWPGSSALADVSWRLRLLSVPKTHSPSSSALPW